MHEPSAPSLQCLDPQGQAVVTLPTSGASRDALRALYRAMVQTRSFDARAVSLQRTGRLGTYASSLGQEAIGVGVASAMRGDDVLLPSFREHGAQLVRGVSLLELLLYWGGDERGSNFAGPRQDFPVSIPVASHAPHAVGVALAFKLRHEDRVAVCMLGDGGTSKGDFYEALNWAGAWLLPVAFVVSNNQWAISTPVARQTAAANLAQKAAAAGIPGSRVDGNDVVAVHQITQEALGRARAGNGPMLIEALTYRLADHTTADNASRYRDDSEVSAAWRREPLVRLRRYLAEHDGWTADDEQRLLARCRAEVDAAADAYLATSAQRPEAMFDYLHAALPAPLAAQREAALAAAANA